MKKVLSNIAVLTAVILLQACSSFGGHGDGLQYSQKIDSHKVEDKIAADVGKLDVGESLISEVANGRGAHEYLVIDTYTAASGRECREVDVMPLGQNSEVDTAVLCKKKTGDWYWPRDVIFK